MSQYEFLGQEFKTGPQGQAIVFPPCKIPLQLSFKGKGAEIAHPQVKHWA